MVAVNVSEFSPLICGQFQNNDNKPPEAALDGIVYIYRLVRDQEGQLNRFTNVQATLGWEYGVPLTIVHPEQFNSMCPMCYELSKELNILVVKLDEAESIFNLDVTQAWEAWKKAEEQGVSVGVDPSAG